MPHKKEKRINMRTPKEYTENMNKGLITEKMLCDCLFSVNKRAKNCRDNERKYRHYRYDKYDTEEIRYNLIITKVY